MSYVWYVMHLAVMALNKQYLEYQGRVSHRMKCHIMYDKTIKKGERDCEISKQPDIDRYIDRSE